MSAPLEPAATVIRKCGGIEATAKAVGRHRSVVNRWLLRRENGGTDGRVPMHHAETLLHTIPGLTEADFFAASAEPERAA